VFKFYFDGSGKEEGSSALTLAGYAGRELDWADFEREWRDILKSQRLQPAYMHMNEAFGLRGEFCERRGWTRDAVVALCRTLNDFLRQLPRDKFCAFRYTVDMDAYRYWRRLEALPPASKQCALNAFLQAFKWCCGGNDRILDKVDVVYDRNETFLNHVHTQWTSRKMRERFHVLRLINTVASAAAGLTPALQAADMVAWSANRLRVGPRAAETDQLCKEIVWEGLCTWHCDLDARYLQKRHGRIAPPTDFPTIFLPG
jgi:hypothetical protein